MPDSETDDRLEAKLGNCWIKSLVLVVAGVVIGLGVVGVVVPDLLIGIGRRMVSPVGLYAAGAIRIGIGIVLILAAREAQGPGTFRAIGAAVCVAGLATPIFGVESARARLDWEAAHLTILRFEGVLFVCLGAMIVSALSHSCPITSHQSSIVNRGSSHAGQAASRRTRWIH